MTITPLLCGEIHYFRVPRKLWRDRLLKLKRAGANCISTYIPWNWHMPCEEVVDFEDKTREWHVASVFSRRLRGFLDIATTLGLKITVRPGPYICAEWEGGGHPWWIYARIKKLRSLDSLYIKHALKWYRHVMPILAEYAERGYIPILQVENEYFWGFVEYIKTLKEEAEKCVRNALVVTNMNWYVEDIVNTIDEYPVVWNVVGFDEELKKYMSSQPGLFKMIMELEGGWFTTLKHGYTPTNRLSFPAQWTELLLKTALAHGLVNMNIYMFHGGTNPGYYTGKYVTTSYDYEAAIREWGELSERYYAIKKIYLFTKTFSHLLSSSERRVEIRPLHTCSDLLIRGFERGAIVVLRNLNDSPCYQKVLLNNTVIPLDHSIRVHPKSAKLILIDYSVSGVFRVNYTTAEPLLKIDYDDFKVLVFHAYIGEVTETFISAMRPFRVTYNRNATVSASENTVKINVEHGYVDSIVVLESESEKLYLLFTTVERAQKTWLIDDITPPLLIISNVYYIGEVMRSNNTLIVNMELDEESCGSLVIVSPLNMESISVSGRKLMVEEITRGVYEVAVPQELCNEREEYRIVLRDLYVREDSVDYEYRYLEPGLNLEEAGYPGVGFYVYKLQLEEPLKPYSRIALLGVQDYGVLLGEGVSASPSYNYIEGVVEKELREFKVLVECTGHSNDGVLYVPCGLVGGLYVDQAVVMYLNEWVRVDYKPPYSSSFSLGDFIENPVEVFKLLKAADSISGIRVKSIEGAGLYIKDLYLESINGRFILDFGVDYPSNYYNRVLVFVNNNYIGPYIAPLDITEYLKPGVNRLALLIEWGQVDPVLRVYSKKPHYKILVQEGVRGLVEKWFKKSDLDMWSKSVLPLVFENSVGRVYWVKLRFTITKPNLSKGPLRLAIRGGGFRAIVFFNGEFLGRLSDDSPIKSLYVFDDLVESGGNDVSILVVITSSRAVIENVELEPYYVHRFEEVVFKLTNP